MSQDQGAPKGLNILCIDGGGIRGLSSLIVLQEIMLRVESASGGQQLHPYEHFDMIAGTGTGGISACMLGRLRMPVQKAIEEYVKLMKSVFTDKKSIGSTVYKGAKLKEALRTMVRDATGDENSKISETQKNTECKTLVFAMAKHNLNASLPVLFRSYTVTANRGPDCAIWEALYATMAHPSLFKSIKIGGASSSQEFVGGELGCSNPIAHVLSEVRRVYPGRQVACVISIGAGHARMIQIPDPSLKHLVLRTEDVVMMKDMATDSERVAEEMAIRFQDIKDVYFRFNVDQGIQHMKAGSWEQREEGVTHTYSYLQKSETHQKLACAVRLCTERSETIPTGHIDGHILGIPAKRSTRLKRCPPPTSIYTGREMENAQVAACIAGSVEERRVCVVYGMGGAGKTQLVLNVIERTRDEWMHVIFVDASSKESIEQTLENFAIVKGIGSTHEAALDWLEDSCERWLVIFDNADSPSTNIRQYIPGGRRGSIVITTRLFDLAGLARGPGSVCRLSGMRQVDGLALLIKAARLVNQNLSEDEREAAEALLKDFGYLALAIIHAGAFIAHVPGMTIMKYRSLFESRRKDMLEQYRKLPPVAKLDDYGETVYTTWKLCYNQLQPDSHTLLALMAYLHYDRIFEGIFEQAALKMQEYGNRVPPNELESLAQNHVQQYLSTFIDPDCHWDTLRFATVMADLTSYSLVDFDRMNLTYSIHVLVQDWARSVVSQPQPLAIECTAALVSLSTGWSDDTQPQDYKCKLAPHVGSVLKHNREIGPNHADRFAVVYKGAGQWRLAEPLAEESLEVRRRVLGQEHEYTLSGMTRLAQVYLNRGRLERAEQLQVQALDAQQRLLGEEYPDTMVSMGWLADTYTQQGRWHKAEELQVKRMNASKRVLGDTHIETLRSISNLGLTYTHLGRYLEAEELHTQVLSTRKQLLGVEHSDTLTSMNNLAYTYSNLSRFNEARELNVQVLEAHRRLLGEEHPDTLIGLANLALTFSNLGQFNESRELNVQVLEARKRLLGEEHPSTLMSLANLAHNYSNLGRFDESRELNVQVLGARRRLLGEEHPKTLISMNNLASTYSDLGRLEEAEELYNTAISGAERVLGNDHPDTCLYRSNLEELKARRSRHDE